MSASKAAALIPSSMSSTISINQSTNDSPITSSLKHFISHPTPRSFVSLCTQFVWMLLPSNRRVAFAFLIVAICIKARKLIRRGHDLSVASRLPLPIDHSIFPQYIVNKDRLWLYCHAWQIAHPIGYVFVSVAYRSHALRYEQLARYLNARGYSVFALDHAGHGQSQGDRGFVEHFDDYVEDFLLFVEHARAALTPKPSFLLGCGMGGTIAIQVMRAYQEIDEERRRLLASRPITPRAHSVNQPDPSNNLFTNIPTPSSSGITSFIESEIRASSWSWSGCILVAPAIFPPPQVSPLSEMLAHLLTDLLPHFGCYSVTDDSKLSRLPAVVAQYAADPLVFKDYMTARWATQLLSVMEELREDSHALTFPFLLLQGSQDTHVNPRGADWLHARAQSKDKKLKRYAGAYHDLLHDLNRDQVMEDIYNWMSQRLPEQD